MTWFSRLLGRLRNDVSSSEIRRGSLTYEALVGPIGNTGLPAPGEASALGVAAIHACVNLIAGAGSSLPVPVYRRSAEGDLTKDMGHDLWWVLNEEFSPRWPASAGWSYLFASRMLHGDGYAEIVRGASGQVRELLPMHPTRVRPIVTPDGRRIVYEIQRDPTIEAPDRDRSRTRVLDQDDVLHVTGFGFDGRRSLSPLRHALRAAGAVAIAQQDFTGRFFANSARPDFTLQTDASLNEEQIERLRSQIEEQHQGPERSHRPMVLEAGLKVAPLTMPLEDLQLLESRKFSVEEIARIYGVPPFMIGHTEKTTSWGAGVEAMGVGFVRFTLQSHLVAFENELNRKFFRSPRFVVRFDTADLERADTRTQMEALRTALGRAGEQPIMTVEEVRQRLSLSARPATPFPPVPAAPAPQPPEAPAGPEEQETPE